MSEPKFKKFAISEKILEELYELTGNSKAYKGFIITYASEAGEPVIYTKCDTKITEYALHRALETYLSDYNQNTLEIEEDQENTWLFRFSAQY